MTQTPTKATRFLTGLSTLLLALSIAFGAYFVIGGLFGVGPSGHEASVHTQVDSDLVRLPEGAMAPDHFNVTVRVPHATLAQVRWFAARDLAPGAVVVAVLWLLRGVLKSVRDGDPFIEANVRRLRALAFVVLIGVPTATFLESVCNSELADSVGLPTGGVEISMPSAALLGGLALLVLAEVFTSGVRLRDDLEGTV